MQLNLTFDQAANAVPAGFMAAMQSAANILMATVSGNYTITINVGYGEINGTTLTGGIAEGGPSTGAYVPFSTVKSDLIAHANNPFQTSAFNALTSQDPNSNGGQIAVWRAQEKALGIIASDNTNDGSIGIGTGWSSSQWLGVALHELTHAMGRISGYASYGILDLFRYSALGTHAYDGTPGNQYFSIDNGATHIANYSNSSDFGDTNGDALSLNDPFAAFYNGGNALTTADLKMIAAMGYALAPVSVSASQAVTAFNANSVVATLAISDSSGNLATNLDALTAVVAAHDVASITDTDAGPISITAAQLANDATVLAAITGPISLSVTATGSFSYVLGSNVNAFALVDGANGNTIIANGLADTITGSAGNDVIYAKGVDSVAGGGGFNTLIMLSSSVSFAVGDTNHTSIQEVVLGGGSNTLSVANTDSDLVYLYGGGAGSTNALTLGSGGGYEIATGGTNHMFGQASGSAVDVFIGGIGASDMHGGTGSNVYYTGAADTVAGAGTYNTDILLATGVTLTYGSGLTNVQQILLNGGTNSVTMTGATGVVYLYGGGGTNTMTLGAGGGYELSTGGTNHMFGQSSGTGTDVFIGNAGTSDMHGGAGSNLYYVGSGDSVFGSTAAGAYNTLLELTPGVALKLGSATLTNVQQFIVYSGNNTVDASAATSQVLIYGGTGNDTVTGGGGNDYFWGGAGTNTFVEKTGWGIDTIQDWTAGAGNHIDLTALAGLGVHAVADLTQTVNGGNLVITSTHTGANSITLAGVGAALGAGSFMFA